MLPVCCLDLPGAVIKKLSDSGFMFVEDIIASDEVFQPEAKNITKMYPDLETVLKDSLRTPKMMTAKELLKEEENVSRILTFSYKLDTILGGGIPLRNVIEICGAPGSGKTQLCMQLCVSVQLPNCLGGLQAEAVYIDTDGGFSPERITEIGLQCKNHCFKVARANKFSIDFLESLENKSFTDYYYMSVNDYSQLLATVFTLAEFLETHKMVKLIIIDSLAFPFLQLTDLMKRTSLLCKIILALNSLAVNHNISVVVTNYLTTRISRGEDQLVPSLGECVGHLINCRLILGFLPIKSSFAAVIFKSPVMENGSAEFQVTRGGIRDIK